VGGRYGSNLGIIQGMEARRLNHREKVVSPTNSIAGANFLVPAHLSACHLRWSWSLQFGKWAE